MFFKLSFSDKAALIRRLLTKMRPEFNAMINQGESAAHTNPTVWRHTKNVVRQLAPDTSNEGLAAALFHDIGKPLAATPDPAKRFTFFGHAEPKVVDAVMPKLREAVQSEGLDPDHVQFLINKHMMPHSQLGKDPTKALMKNVMLPAAEATQRGGGNVDRLRRMIGDLRSLSAADMSDSAPAFVDKNKATNAAFQDALTGVVKPFDQHDSGLQRSISDMGVGPEVLNLLRSL